MTSRRQTSKIVFNNVDKVSYVYTVFVVKPSLDFIVNLQLYVQDNTLLRVTNLPNNPFYVESTPKEKIDHGKAP